MRTSLGKLRALILVVSAVLLFPSAAAADSLGLITFEQSQGYVATNIHGQPIGFTVPNGKWSKLGPYDVEVELVSSFPAAAGYGFGSQALRISDAMTSGSFGDQTFSPGLGDEAGESGASNLDINGQPLSGGLRQPHFAASFLIGTTQATQQCIGCIGGPPDFGPNPLHMSVSPDRGDGARMSYLRFEDQADGVHVFFVDVVDKGPVGTEATFREYDVATLSRTASHLIQFSIEFKDGAANDTAKIYIDGKLVKTGTTWEDYYRFDPEQTPDYGNQIPTVDKLLFRVSGFANPTDIGKGFLIDRVTLESSGLNLRK
jgi:opacity protein-like surface antigen